MLSRAPHILALTALLVFATGSRCQLPGLPSQPLFASPQVVPAALSSRNEIAIVDVAPPRYEIRAERLRVTAQEPRAIRVRDGRLYVAGFESGNRSEISVCGAADGTPQCAVGLLETVGPFAANRTCPASSRTS